jgi:hypothetical protein
VFVFFFVDISNFCRVPYLRISIESGGFKRKDFAFTALAVGRSLAPGCLFCIYTETPHLGKMMPILRTTEDEYEDEDDIDR